MDSGDSYRDRKIAFVSNLNGTTAYDVILHSLYVCLVLVCNRVVYRWCLFDQNSRFVSTVLNFLTIAVPMILGVTLLADFIGICCIVCLAITSICVVSAIIKRRPAASKKNLWNLDASSCVSAALVDNRYVLFYGTTVAILAVDFTIFPRRLAKTELSGFSVMDVGVGLFGFYYGFFAREIRNPPKFFDMWNFFKALLSTAPLSIIAFGRLIAVKLSGYPEHVTEYGVHWNFFFTLAFVRVGVSLILLFFPYPRQVGVLSLVLFALYSMAAMNSPTFSDWLINTPEDRRSLSLIDQNKEGVVSLPGFIAMYLLGMQLGAFLQPVLQTKHKNISFYECFVWMIKLLLGAFLTALVCTVSHVYIQPCSRRLANFAYIFWVLFNFLLMLATCLFGALLVVLVDNQKTSRRSPAKKGTEAASEADLLLLPRAFNSNTLALFLLANILTGIVNLMVDTISTPPFVAFTVVSLYCFLVSSVASFLYCSKITLKFW